MPDEPLVAFLQDGARLHYAIPIALHRASLLDRVFCDWYSSPGSLSRLLAKLMKIRNPALGRRMLDRYHPALADAHVLSNPRLAIRILRQRKKISSNAAFYQWAAAERGNWVRHKGFGNANTVMGFMGNIPNELLAYARSQGLVTIADQIIAAVAIDREEDRLRRQRFPDWSLPEANIEHDSWIENEHTSWNILDHVTCASTYVRDGLVAQGVPNTKISVLPYPLDIAHFPITDRSNRPGPLMVGFVGGVNLRKGVPYFLQVARRFDPQKVKFTMVGPIQIPANIAAQFQPHVELIGSVPRSEIPSWLAKFDIYYFPSTCEGSAGSVSEAMATGLPIVASPNAGSVVTHGQEGFICNYDDIDSAADHIQHLIADRELRLEMGRRAAAYYRIFDLAAHAARLKDIVSSVYKANKSAQAKPTPSHPH